jgi:hypothetical protein
VTEAHAKTVVEVVIDRDDIMINRYTAGRWVGPNNYVGFNYSTTMGIKNARGHVKGGVPLTVTVSPDGHTIEVRFPSPVQPGQRYAFKLQLLMDPDIIQHLGGLRILNWPKEDVSEVVVLAKAWPLLFTSALAEIRYDERNKYHVIRPANFAKQLTSHATTATALRLEWGESPTVRLHFHYSLTNSGPGAAAGVMLKTFIPTETKLQAVSTPAVGTVVGDEDGNRLLSIPVGEIPAGTARIVEFFVDIRPLGNKANYLPDFGSWDEIRGATIRSAVGSLFVQPSKYWNYGDPQIQELVAALKRRTGGLSEYVKLAFEYTNQKLSYAINNARVDAAATMRTKTGDCSEFSDLFVAVLRGGGIPAKIVHGWVLEPRTLALEPHAWCEFFSRKHGWLQCDPTWGYLTGVSCHHLTRHREGINPDQNTFSWSYTGNTKIQATESLSAQII